MRRGNEKESPGFVHWGTPASAIVRRSIAGGAT